jgi:hypothetical protein
MPKCEPLEDRLVPTTGAFLQGFAFVDANGNGQFDSGEGQAGTTIQLFAADLATLHLYTPSNNLSTVLGTLTSDSIGYYIFNDSDVLTNNLHPGNYNLVETPPAGFFNSFVDIHSQLDPATAVNASTINVSLTDPAHLMAKFDAFSNGGKINPQFNGMTEPAFSGQLLFNLTAPGFDSGVFKTLCANFNQRVTVGSTFQVLPATLAAGAVNGGEIAYLYDHFGTMVLSNTDANALQQVIWTLIHGSAYTPDLSNAAVAASYNNFLALAQGKAEEAIFLDAGTPAPGQGQSVMATGSLNFANAQANDSITTTPGGPVVIGSGSLLTDSATLSTNNTSTPLTGTITFQLFDSTNAVVDTETVPVNGAGTYTTPNGFLPTTTGTYQWVASYSGDANHNPISSPFGSEPETVTPASPNITTNAGGTVVIGSGAKLTDSATLSGGFMPTGTITFTLTGPGGGTVDTETVTVSGDATYTTPMGFLPLAAGTYHWVAAYSGDTNNNPVSSGPNDEPETVTQASPAITTQAGSNVVIGSGARLTDSAMLSGGFNPTGTITFTLTGPGGGTVDTETVTVNGDGTYTTPMGFLPLTTGTYHWVAAYSGDSNNNPVSSGPNDEPETVTQASPAITTLAGGNVVIGSGVRLTDSAMLSGGFNPTGFINFTLTGPGFTTVDMEAVPVNGDGTYTTPNGFLPQTTGTYQWVASYTGDINNSPVASRPGDEPETVTPASPTINTMAFGPVVIGSGMRLRDTAMLSLGFNPTGFINFTLTGPGGTTVDMESVQVNGDGVYSTPNGFLPLVTGTYQWVASYTGDSNNNPVSSRPGDEPETVTPASPAINTMAFGPVVIGSGIRLRDTAMLSLGFNPTGSITFTLTGPGGTTVDTETVPVNGDGAYSTPNGFLPLVTGTYQWVASYSGDANNNPVTSRPGDEPETVTAASPAINTLAGPPVVVGSGVALTDSAQLSLGFNPTGSITFTLTAPDGMTVVDTETVPVNGDGTYTTPNGFVPSATGTYQWVASYSGDINNNSVSSRPGDEPETVTSASPAINTTPGGQVVLGSGDRLTDSAMLSGGFNPTGMITFTLTAPGGGVVDTETVTVNGDGTYTTPTGFLPMTIGTYQWVASYSGDTNNKPVASAFGDEPETVTSNMPAITTTAGGPVVIGSGNVLTDTAVLSGGTNPTGSITFTLTAPDGTTVVDTETVPVNGDGSYTTPNGFLPTSTGIYQWVAAYSGDINNNPVSSRPGDEPETVIPASPTITTNAGGTVVIGSGAKLTDSATLSGGVNPTGTITFTLTSPSSSIVDTETVTVNGDGTFTTPMGFLPLAAGTYQWVATYSGDANNNGADSGFGNEPETVTPASPSVTTNPGPTVVFGSGVPLTDTATLSGGFMPTGMITFVLRAPDNTTIVDVETVTVNGDGTYTTPTGFVPTTTGTYQWKASYGGDANNFGTEAAFGNEPEIVVPGPSITTTPGSSVVIGSGTPLTDTAMLSGGLNPTGTITFTLTAPDGMTVVDTETVPVNGDGTYTTPNGFQPTATGTYQWVATYSGDSVNPGVTSRFGDEPETVTPASPSVTTNPGPTVVFGSGVPLTDTATLSGGFMPTGMITFVLLAPDNTTIVDVETVTVNGDGTYTTPTGFVPTTTGTYQWKASYGGDANNFGTEAAFGNEPEIVVAAPTITTTPGGSVVIGSGTPLTDTAMLSGGLNPTGTITFTLTAPDGMTVVDTETVPVNGDGTYTTPTGFQPTATGTYQWVASYSGDSVNPAVTSRFGDEPETVTPASPNVVTNPGPTVVLGSGIPLTDSATLSGGFMPTGTITFDLKDPNNNIVDSETVTVNGDGTYTTPTGFVPTVVGTYEWRGTYSGDGNNFGTEAAFDEPETVTQAMPMINTQPGPTVVIGSGVLLTDAATLSGGFSPTGTITFELHDPGNNIVDMETVSVNGNGTYTTPNGFPPFEVGTYQWVATYSGDTNNDRAISNLGDEPETVIANTPMIMTVPGGTVVIGDGNPLTDTAMLSKTVGIEVPAGGTITFTLTDPNGMVVDTETVPVRGDGTYTTPMGFVPMQAGTYQWVAAYSGDANNNPVSSAFGDEPETVTPVTPAITTNAGAPVVIGSGNVLTDSATLSGGFNPTGTITFTLTAPDGMTVVDTETVTVMGNATYTTPNGFLPTGTGIYHWVAAYSGDMNNNPVASGAGDEPETVTSASPMITTNAGGTVVVGSGNVLTDSATLSGGFNPTGTITFTLTAPDGMTVVDTETVPVMGNATYTTPNGFLPMATGTYHWVAAYSGDMNNNSVSSGTGDEPETVLPASPMITTNAGGTVVIGSGAKLTDSATLSGGFMPTGNITFTLTAPGGGTVDTETVTVNGNGTYTTPNGFLPMTTGTYHWVAFYSGDSNNNRAASGEGDEPETVIPASPMITTNAGGTVVVGSGNLLTDSATLSGGFSPTGTITFTLTAPDGTTVVDTETVTVMGNATYTTPTGFLPTATGTYHWVAAYSGDVNNNPLTSGAGDEPETVIPASPMITTNAGGTVVIGSGNRLTDSATLSGGFNPTGTITFTLTGPGGTTVDTETVTVHGNGTYTTPTGSLPTATGTYQWVASYSGDTNNNPVASRPGDEPETVTPASPMITTTAGGSVVVGSGARLTDSASLSGGFNPTGTITFTLTGPGGTTVDTETVIVNGNGLYTTPTGFLPTATGTYHWVAAYSGDMNNNPVRSGEGEEPETVTAASPMITTNAGGTVVIGSGARLTDSATLTGGFNPTGTITFTLTGPGGTTVDTETATVNGNGAYTTPTGFLPTAIGTYQWVASYSGDSNNHPVASRSGDEPETVTPASPTITTTAGGPVRIGSGARLTDSATLSGGFNPTGTITFVLTAPGGGVVDTETVTVNGNGTYTTPSGFLPTTLGIYQWVAAYGGDAHNNPVSSNPGDEPETVVPSGPAITTQAAGPVILGLGGKLRDSATLSGGTNPTGTITFTLTAPGGSVVDTETVTVNGDGTYTTPNGYLPNKLGTDQWVASYSGDANNSPVSSLFGDEPERVVPPSTFIIPFTNLPPTPVTIFSKFLLLGSNIKDLQANANFVNSLYHDILGRQGDQAGVNAWFAALEFGESRFEVAQAFWVSPEHRDIEVAQFYQIFLNRTASAAERAGWVNQFLAGATEQTVELGFVTSPEYSALNPTNSSYVTALYNDLLNRDPSAGELTAWDAALAAGLPRTALAENILSSNEYDITVIDGFYLRLLERPPDLPGLAGWLAFLKGGGTIDVLAESILTSPEYFNGVH